MGCLEDGRPQHVNLSFPLHFELIFIHYRVGAVFGSEFALWDISKLQGGKPFETGISFPEGSHRFR